MGVKKLPALHGILVMTRDFLPTLRMCDLWSYWLLEIPIKLTPALNLCSNGLFPKVRSDEAVFHT